MLSMPAWAQMGESACGNPFVNGFGPYDYRTEQGQNRKIVEDYHFTPMVESLISGKSAPLGADIDYTLRAFPNHHRALVAMMNLAARTRTATAPTAQFSVECYFRRALQFRPDDAVARMLCAKYLGSIGQKSEASRQLDYVVDHAGDGGFTHHNAGLVYAELGEYEKALTQAHRALQYGFDRPDLKQKLVAAGKWREPPVEAAAPESSASSPPPAEAPK